MKQALSILIDLGILAYYATSAKPSTCNIILNWQQLKTDKAMRSLIMDYHRRKRIQKPLFFHYFSLLICYALIAQPALAHGDLELQIEVLTAQIEEQSEQAQLHFQRAELYRRIMAWDSALDGYSAAETLGYSKDELDYFRGRMHLEAGNYKQANLHLSRLLVKYPEHTRALIARAKIPSSAPLDAVADLDIAIKNSVRPAPDLFLDRAKLTIEAGSEHFERAISGLEEGIAHFGPVVSLIDFAVSQCEINQNWKLAINMVKKLPEHVQLSPNWLFRMGELHQQALEFELARDFYASAVQKIQQLPNSRLNTAATRQLENEIVSAIKSLPAI